MLDLHTHTTFSFDGQSAAEQTLARAAELGMEWYGLSEHFNYDCIVLNYPVEQIDAERYFADARRLKEEYRGRLRVLVGAEFGFDGSGMAQDMYKAVLSMYRPDYVINSVHFTRGHESDTVFTAFRGRDAVYGNYLECVRESLNASYRYDIVGHIGYLARYSPFEKKEIAYADFPDLYDDILREIVRRDKILELNGSTGGIDSPCVPTEDVLYRYFELGGRRVSYGSDSHSVPSIGRNYQKVAALLKRVGFASFTVPAEEGYAEVPVR